MTRVQSLAIAAVVCAGLSAGVLAQAVPVASIGGKVVDAVTGEPVAGAVVSLLRPAGGSVDTVRTASDGAFRILEVADGTWGVGATASGYRGTSGTGRVHLTTVAGRPVTGVVVRLRPLGIIEGMVTTSSGEAVVGVDVQLARAVARGQFAAGPKVSTDDRGVFRAAVQNDGEYVVLVPAMAAPVPDGPFGRPGETPKSTFLYASARSAPVLIEGGAHTARVDVTLSETRGVAVSGLVTGPAASHLNGAPVTLRPADSVLPPTLEGTRAIVQPDGRFAFPLVGPGRYILEVLRSGAPAAPDVTVFAQQDVAIGESSREDLVLLADFGIPVSGQLVFDGASPRPALSGANGLSLLLQPTSRQESVFLNARFNPDGSFTTRQVPRGWSYYAFVLAPPPWSFRSATYRGRDVSSDPLQIDEPLTEPIVVTLTDQGPRLVGTVRNRQGNGVTQTVVVFPVDRRGWTDARTNRRLQSTTSDLAGVYRFDRLPADTYYVALIEDSEGPVWNDPATLRRLSQVAIQVTLTEGRTSTVDLMAPDDRDGTGGDDADRPRGPFADQDVTALPQATTLTGLVTTTGSSRVPLAGATVLVRRADDGVVWSMFTDAQGRFSFKDLGAGQFEVSASKPGFVPARFSQPHPDLPGRRLQLSEGQSRALEVHLSRGGVIEGTVRGAEGRPVAGAAVKAMRLRHAAAGTMRLEPAGQQAAMFTDELGRFRIFGLAPGRYVVAAAPVQLTAVSAARADGPGAPIWAHSETYYPQSRSFSDARVIELSAGGIHDGTDIWLTFAQTSAVSGRVVMPDGLAALQSARISLTVQGDLAPDPMVVPASRGGDVAAPTAIITPTARDGSFRLSLLPPGAYTLRAEARNGDEAWGAAVDVAVSDRDLNDVVLRLDPVPAIDVTLKWPETLQASKPSVRIAFAPDFAGAPSGVLSVPIAGEVGRARVRLYPGAYRVLVEGLPAGWFLAAPVMVNTLSERREVEVVITHVPNPFEGMAQASAGYALAVSSDSHAYFASIDDEGRYRFEHLPPGRYALRILTTAEAIAAVDMPVAARGALAAVGTVVVVPSSSGWPPA